MTAAWRKQLAEKAVAALAAGARARAAVIRSRQQK